MSNEFNTQLYGMSQALLSGAIAAGDSRRARKWQEKMYQRQLQDALMLEEMAWQKNIEYNSPKAQMARYQEAGINPMAVLGNIASGSSASYQAPPLPEAPGYSGDALLRGLQAGQQMLNQMQQTAIDQSNQIKQGQLIDKQIDKTAEDIESSRVQQSNILSQIAERTEDKEIKRLTKKFLEDSYDDRLRSNKYQTDLVKEEFDKAVYYNTHIAPAVLESYIDKHKESVKDILLKDKQLQEADKRLLLMNKELTSKDLSNMLMKYNLEHMLPKQYEELQERVAQLIKNGEKIPYEIYEAAGRAAAIPFQIDGYKADTMLKIQNLLNGGLGTSIPQIFVNYVKSALGSRNSDIEFIEKMFEKTMGNSK